MVLHKIRIFKDNKILSPFLVISKRKNTEVRCSPSLFYSFPSLWCNCHLHVIFGLINHFDIIHKDRFVFSLKSFVILSGFSWHHMLLYKHLSFASAIAVDTKVTWNVKQGVWIRAFQTSFKKHSIWYDLKIYLGFCQNTKVHRTFSTVLYIALGNKTVLLFRLVLIIWIWMRILKPFTMHLYISIYVAAGFHG